VAVAVSVGVGFGLVVLTGFGLVVLTGLGFVVLTGFGLVVFFGVAFGFAGELFTGLGEPVLPPTTCCVLPDLVGMAVGVLDAETAGTVGELPLAGATDLEPPSVCGLPSAKSVPAVSSGFSGVYRSVAVSPAMVPTATKIARFISSLPRTQTIRDECAFLGRLRM